MKALLLIVSAAVLVFAIWLDVGGIASSSYKLIDVFKANPLLTFDPERK